MARRFNQAWSLPEILAVLGVISGLCVIGLPALNGLIASQARRASIDLVMGWMDRARSAAIAQGRPTYVVFADQQCPEHSFRAAAIFQDNENPALAPVMLSRWESLPAGCRFDGTGNSVFTAPQESLPDGTPATFPVPHRGTLPLPHLKFDATGSVLHPATTDLSGVSFLSGLGRVAVARATGWPRFIESAPSRP
jgi:type II secretory pathway pseudopilin PulG